MRTPEVFSQFSKAAPRYTGSNAPLQHETVDQVLIKSPAASTPLACATAMAHPVTAVQEFFQKAGQTGPEALVYEFSDYCTDTPVPEKRFVCSLKTPRVVSTEQGIVRCVLEVNLFQGEGRKKADAKRDAAASALAFLQQQPLWEAQHRLPPLRDVLAACFTNQGILQDPDLKAWWAYCQQYALSTDSPTTTAAAGGEAVPMTCPVSLPLTALAHSKHLVGWIKQQQQQQGNQGSSSRGLDVSDIVQLMRHIQGLLHEAAASGTLPEGVSVDSHGLSVSRQQQQQQQSGAAGVSGGTQRSRDQDVAAASPPVRSTLDHEVWDESSIAVLVPADTRSQVSQVQLQSPAAAAAAHGSPDLLHQVCALLQMTQPQSLVVWGRVGPRVSHPALPAEWAAARQQWERVHAALQQQQQQQQGKDRGQQEPPQGQGGGGVLAHLSGGTSVLLGASKHQQARSHKHQQQQQQQGEAGASGGGPPPSAVVLGTARQASASTLQNEPQPPKKRLHTVGEPEAGTAAAAAAVEAAGAAEPSTTTLSRVSLLAVGGGPAVMDWEGSTQQGSEEVKGPPGAARSILPPDTPTDSDTAAAGGSSSSTLSPHVVDIGPPVMYSVFFRDQGSAEAAGLNLRASWLAGRRVYGPVLLAGSGIMRGAGTYNVVKWRSYTADTFWAAVSGLLPAAAHSSSRVAHGGCTLTRLPTQYRSTCWLGPHPRHLLETYTTRHAHWLARVCPQLPSLQQQQLQAAQAAAAAAGEGGGNGTADSSSSAKNKLPVLMSCTISVEDAAEPASNSPTGFNCRAQLRVYPVAATAAAAAAAAAGSIGSSAGGSWLRVLGCGSEAEGLAVLENLSVAVGSQAGPCAAEAHVVVEDGRLVVVADSGLALGPVDAQNIAALAALHLLTALEAAPLTGSRPEPPTTAGAAAAAATEAAAAELEALVVAAETDAAAAAAASGAADKLLMATAGTADVAAAAVDTAVVAAGGSEMYVDGGGGAGSLGDVELLWSAACDDADGSGLLQPAVGRMAKINAHLYLPNSSSPTPAGSQLPVRPGDPGCYSLDVLRCYSLLLGSRAVVDQAEALVRTLRVGGAAQMRVQLCLQGPDLLQRFSPVEAVLAVQLLEVSLPKPSTAAAAAGGRGGGEAAAGPALFDPPLGLQRWRLVSELVRRCDMASVVDLGCGDGGLIKHLLCEAGFSALSSIVGVDVSARELAAAARRLQGMQSHWMALQPSTAPPAAGGGGGCVGVSAGSVGAAGAAAPAGAAEGAAAAGYEGEGSTVSGLGAAVGRLTSTAASFEAQSRHQEQLQQSGTSEGVSSFIQGTADSFTGMTGDFSRQQLQQQQQGLSAAGVSSAASDGTSCAIQLQLLQGDLTNPGLALPSSGFWQAHGLNPGSVDLAACIEVLEHLEPQAVDALGHSVLGGLFPKVAVFSTPNWEYNVLLRAINTGVAWPGPPGRDGQPLRHGDHKFEWSRAEFRAWAAAMAGRHGYSIEFVDIGRAPREQEVLAAVGGLQEQQQQARSGGVAAAAAEARAAGAAADAADVVLSALPSVTAAAGPSALAAAEAATAAVVQAAAVQAGSSAAAAVDLLERVVQAGEQQEQQQQALVAGLARAGGRQGSNDTAEERQQVKQDVAMQDPFQDPFQQASIGPGSLGGASQAAIFRLLPGAEAAVGGAAAVEGDGGGDGGGGGGLCVVWGPMTAVLRVGSFQGAGEAAGPEDSGVLATVDTEHF